MATWSRRPQSTPSLPWEPQISYCLLFCYFSTVIQTLFIINNWTERTMKCNKNSQGTLQFPKKCITFNVCHEHFVTMLFFIFKCFQCLWFMYFISSLRGKHSLPSTAYSLNYWQHHKQINIIAETSNPMY
jgi:hypothetical protein